jgi:CRP/FNR family cyclic AMP-dependent transcriptional regulator
MKPPSARRTKKGGAELSDETSSNAGFSVATSKNTVPPGEVSPNTASPNTASPNTVGRLSGLDLFRGVSPGELARISALVGWREFPAGASVILADQPGDALFFILSGSVKIFVEREGGVEATLAILGPGEILGEMSLADSLRRSANAATREESTLLWMDRSSFHSFLAQTPAISTNLISILSRRLRLANARTRFLVSLDVRGRVAAQLLAFANEYGEEVSGGVRIPFRLTQTDIADLVGASRVRVNHVLGFHKRQGHVSAGRDHRITVHDLDALARSLR